jgi:dTDP-4-dehydrorhamnose 3,5-epimerase
MGQLGLVDGVVIDGVQTAPIDEVVDERGTFAEYFVAGRDLGIHAVQWSVVRSTPGTLRGMHFHARHDEYFALVSGRATVGLHDLRPGSPTFGGSATYEFAEREPVRLIFPRGLVHGWLFHEPSIHLQATSEAHVHYGRDDNHGCRWDDPALGIAWPFEPTTLSVRADGFGTLEQLRSVASISATG